MLFGHQNDDANTQAQPADIPPPPPQPVTDMPEPVADPMGTAQSGVNPLAVDPATGISLPVAPTDEIDEPEPSTSVLDQPSSLDSVPSTPVVTPEASSVFSPEATRVDATDLSTTAAEATDEPSEDTTPANDDLLALKQKALSDLSPLVGKLDQTAEEKFRTTMMLIQSSDDESLLPTAYEAAQQIDDEKVRAQALLDVVNEINYFTQQKN